MVFGFGQRNPFTWVVWVTFSPLTLMLQKCVWVGMWACVCVKRGTVIDKTKDVKLDVMDKTKDVNRLNQLIGRVWAMAKWHSESKSPMF